MTGMVYNTPMSELEMVFTVAEFNEAVASHLALLGEVVVEGEISRLQVSQGKWVFATIKDKTASVDVFGVAFELSNLRSLAEGMLVKVYGQATLYQKSGRFSIRAFQISPSGEGALAQAYEKLKLQLEGEGIFAPERKRKLPELPERIGLITAQGSEAYNDFVKVLGERRGGIDISFYPVQVQGRDAVKSVLAAIEYFNQSLDQDVIVITRGGGSLEDLAAFNDEAVVRAVFGSKIPVICAIGHEGDVSLCELAADQRASTPTNAAMLVSRDRNEVTNEIQSLVNTMQRSIEQDILIKNQLIDTAVSRIDVETERKIGELNQTINRFRQAGEQIEIKITQYGVGIDTNTSRLDTRMEYLVTEKNLLVDNLERLLKSLDYRQVLKRGYSITFSKTGKVIKDLSEIIVGETMITQLALGSINSVIKEKKQKKIE